MKKNRGPEGRHDDVGARQIDRRGDYVYDSVDGMTGIEDADVIELCDIGAEVGGKSGTIRDDVPTQVFGSSGRVAPVPELGFVDVEDAPGLRSGDAGLDAAFDGIVDATVATDRPSDAVVIDPAVRGATEPSPDGQAEELPLSAFVPTVLAFTNPNHAALSQFRILKYKIEDYIDKLQYRSFAITSARREEGVTSTTLNLAAVMSENPWLKLVLVDLNLRNPALEQLARRAYAGPGLLQVLSGRAKFDDALAKFESRNLFLLHSGGRYEASMDVLNSPQFDLLLNRLYEAFDLVLIDTPPVLEGDDALIIKQKVDGVFLVMRAETTPVGELNRAAERLGKDRILGVVLNQVRAREVR